MEKNIYSGIPENAFSSGSNPFMKNELKSQLDAGAVSLKSISDQSISVDSSEHITIFAKEESGSIKLMQKNYSGSVSVIGGTSSPETVIYNEIGDLSDLFSSNDIVEGNKAYVNDTLYRYSDSGNDDVKGFNVTGFQNSDYNGTYVRYQTDTDVGDRNYYYYNIENDVFIVHDNRWLFVTDLEDISNTIVAKNSSTDGWSIPSAFEINWVSSDEEPLSITFTDKPWASYDNWQIDAIKNVPQDDAAYVRVNNYWYKYMIEFEGEDVPFDQGNFNGQFAHREGALYIWIGSSWINTNIISP